MAERSVDGYYWLKFNVEDNICSQCNQPIKEGEDIFVDAEGVFKKSKGMIKIRNISIYHYGCIIDIGGSGLRPEDY